ncbi:ArnT family glycosyltransferase [Telmatobacter bradus]|uniref:ArnT family glycosyltransferase n=1 Tax=Telmatobacter bradus TaxID=474953 RepID=UPI003B43B76D
MNKVTKCWLYGLWLVIIAGFAAVHALHLRADFPNYSHWFSDWAKYTDEGWYGAAAIRAHLFGNWYHPGDLNTAVALPVWPFLEWVLFFFTGVTVEAARGLAIFFFFVNTVLVYLLMRHRAPRWAGMLAVTLMVTSPFYYCFSRLAILEPSLTCWLLLALNLAVRLKRFSRPLLGGALLGVLFAVMMLTKTTAVFLVPALAWAAARTLWPDWKKILRTAAATAGMAALIYGSWLALVKRAGLMEDYHYLFFINKYPKPREFYWPLVSFGWSFHGGLWLGRVLFVMAVLVLLGAIAARKRVWGYGLLTDPVFGASVLTCAGYIGFMAYQNHPQPRYFVVVALFAFILVAQGAAALLDDCYGKGGKRRHKLGLVVIAVVIAVTLNGAVWIGRFTLNPSYTFAQATDQLTRYIDEHPNGKRLLLSISDDEITLMTHLPGICDDFGTRELVTRTAEEKPGWYAAWNDLDPGTLEDLHIHYSLEQVADFPAYDDPDRNHLVLFKLHPLSTPRDYNGGDLRNPLPDDKILVDIE